MKYNTVVILNPVKYTKATNITIYTSEKIQSNLKSLFNDLKNSLYVISSATTGGNFFV